MFLVSLVRDEEAEWLVSAVACCERRWVRDSDDDGDDDDDDDEDDESECECECGRAGRF
jgi:hypothetical protein